MKGTELGTVDNRKKTDVVLPRGIYRLGKKPTLSSLWRETQSLGLCWERQEDMQGHIEHPGKLGGRIQKGSEAKARERAPKGIKGGWRQTWPISFGGRQAIRQWDFSFSSAYCLKQSLLTNAFLWITHLPLAALIAVNYLILAGALANINKLNKLRDNVSSFIFLLLFHFFYLEKMY